MNKIANYICTALVNEEHRGIDKFSIKTFDDFKIFKREEGRIFLESKDEKERNHAMHVLDFSKISSFDFDGLPKEEFEKIIDLDGKKFISDYVEEKDEFLEGSYIEVPRAFLEYLPKKINC